MSLARGSYIDPGAGRQTFREYAEKWRANQSHYRANSARKVEQRLRLHIYPYIGDVPIGALRRTAIQGMVGKWTPGSAAINMQTLRTVLNAAVLDEVISKSPAVSIALAQHEADEVIVPTVDQVLSMADAMGRWGSLIMLASTTGMRRSELLAITLESFSLDERTVRVRPDRGQVVFTTGNHGRLGPPKSRAAARTIPVGNVAVGVASAWIADVMPNPRDGYGGAFFLGPRTGRLIHPNTFGPKLQTIMQAHGFPIGTGMHLFRHFYASALIEAGESVKVVQKRLGHASAVETLDIYGHLWPDTDEGSRSAIDEAFDRE